MDYPPKLPNSIQILSSLGVPVTLGLVFINGFLGVTNGGIKLKTKKKAQITVKSSKRRNISLNTNQLLIIQDKTTFQNKYILKRLK